MNGFETLILEPRDGILWVTLNRPQVLNALNLRMRDELWAVLELIELDEEIRVAVFKGAGDRAFSAGADLNDFGTAPSLTEARRGRMERDLWGRLARLEKPLIAAIHGYALGAGCELSLLCDFRIASEDVLIGLPEVSLGYLPTAGGTQMLPRTIGRGLALDMILSGEPVPAGRALEHGVVHRIVPRDRLDEEAGRWARELADRPADALRLTKRAVVQGMELPLVEGLRFERHLSGLLSRRA
jgi:enoyl-CoA hydratase/carnithine racemase